MSFDPKRNIEAMLEAARKAKAAETPPVEAVPSVPEPAEEKSTPVEPPLEPVEHGPIHDYKELEEIVPLPSSMPEPSTESKAPLPAVEPLPVESVTPKPAKAEVNKEEQEKWQKQMREAAAKTRVALGFVRSSMEGWRRGTLPENYVPSLLTQAETYWNVFFDGLQNDHPEIFTALEGEIRQLDKEFQETFDIYNQQVRDVEEKRSRPASTAKTETTPAKPEKAPVKPEVIPATAPAVAKTETAATPLTLEEARKAFLSAKQKHDDIHSIFENLFKGGIFKKDTKAKVDKEFKAAKSTFEKARAEYVGTSIDRFIEEQNKQLEQRFEENRAKSKAGQKVKSGLRKAGEVWEKMGERNLAALLHSEKTIKCLDAVKLGGFGKKAAALTETKWGGRVARSINLRTAVSYSLLGVGLYAGAGSAVGTAAIIGRRYLAGLSAGIGARNIVDLGVAKGFNKLLERKEIDSKSDYWDYALKISDIENKGLLAGKTISEIQSDPEYQELSKAYEQKLRESKVDLEKAYTPEEIAYFLDKRLKQIERDVDDDLTRRKGSRTAQKIISTGAGLVVGGIVGGGYWARALGHGVEKLRGGGAASAVASPEAALQGTGKITAPDQAPSVKVPVTEQGGVKPSVVEHGATDQAPKTPEVETKAPPAEPKAAPAETHQAVQPEAKTPTTETEAVEPEVKAPVTETKVPAAAESGEVKVPQPPHVEFKDLGEGKFKIDVNQRGIEGSILDLLKNKDFAGREKILEYLKHFEVEGPKAHNTPKHLVHRWILHLANEHAEQDWSVGDGGKYDLDRVLQGAHIEVDSDGELVLKDLKFMHPVEAPGGIPSVEAPAVPSMVEQQYPEYAHPNFQNLQGELPHAPIPPQPHPGEVLPYREGVNRALEELQGRTSVPGQSHIELTPENSVSGAKQVTSELPDSSTGTQAETAHVSESLDQSVSVSNDLKEKLGSLYGEFMENNLHMAPESLDKVQDMKLSEVMKMFKDDKKYSGLTSLISGIKEWGKLTENYFETTDVKSFLRAYARLLVEQKN